MKGSRHRQSLDGGTMNQRGQRGFVCVAISSRTQAGQWHSGLNKPLTGHALATGPPRSLVSRSAVAGCTSYNVRDRRTDPCITAPTRTAAVRGRFYKSGCAALMRGLVPRPRRDGAPLRGVNSRGAAMRNYRAMSHWARRGCIADNATTGTVLAAVALPGRGWTPRPIRAGRRLGRRATATEYRTRGRLPIHIGASVSNLEGAV